jgi:TonB family protein
MVPRLIVAVAMLLAWMPSTLAQRGRSAEDMFRARISAQPQQLQPYLDLANFYFSERRYDDFDQTLKAALKVIRQAQARAGADGTVPKPAPEAQPFRVGTDVAAPVRLREVKPEYPQDVLQRGGGGSVTLDITIDTRGLVSDARVTRSVDGLDDPALAAVRQWEFAPSFHGGEIVPVVMELRLTFIPETKVRLPQSSRRQVPMVLGLARRHFDQGAYGPAEVVLNTVLLASQRERAEPTGIGAAATAGVTTSEWPVRGGRDVKAPAKTRDVGVLYPPEAVQARSAGIVTFEFVVDEAGKVTRLRRLGMGEPLFEQAARQALEQWEYAPTTIAGTTVPVAISVTFAFQPDRGIVEEVVRVGGPGEITEPKKIRHVAPVYPADAQRSRTQGVVIIETVISRDGLVGSMRIVRSAGPALDKAVMDAVGQWEFTPTRLYGIPVAVVMTVTVAFSLN